MPRYNVCAASRPGSKHDFLDENNQDAWAVGRLDDGVALAVCDGAGSRPHSRLGADRVSAMAVSFLEALDWTAEFGPQAEEFIRRAQSRLAADAAERGLSAGDLSCTVLAVAAASRGLRALQVGDGFIVTRSDPAARYELLLPIAKGEHANETVFVTQHDAADRMHTFAGAAAPHFLCLSSDGVERQAIRLRESEPYAPFFDYLGRVAASGEGDEYLARFLAMPSLDEVTDDDRTLACAIRLPEEDAK